MTTKLSDLKTQLQTTLAEANNCNTDFQLFAMLVKHYGLTPAQRRELGELVFSKYEKIFIETFNRPYYGGSTLPRIFGAQQDGAVTSYYANVVGKLSNEAVAGCLPLDAAARLKLCAQNGLADSAKNCAEHIASLNMDNSSDRENASKSRHSMQGAVSFCQMLFEAAAKIEKSDPKQIKKIAPKPKVVSKPPKIKVSARRKIIFNEVATNAPASDGISPAPVSTPPTQGPAPAP